MSISFMKIEAVTSDPNLLNSMVESDSDNKLCFAILSKDYVSDFETRIGVIDKPIDVINISDLNADDISMRAILRGDDNLFLKTYKQHVMRQKASLLTLMLKAFFEFKSVVVLYSATDRKYNIPNVILTLLKERYVFNHIAESMLESDLSILIQNPREFNVMRDSHRLASDTETFRSKYPDAGYPTGDEVLSRLDKVLGTILSEARMKNSPQQSTYNTSGLYNNVGEDIENPFSILTK